MRKFGVKTTPNNVSPHFKKILKTVLIYKYIHNTYNTYNTYICIVYVYESLKNAKNV